MASQWGRKETVIWPPQVPIYTYGVLLLTVPITLTLLCGLYMTKPFLARNYTGAFIKSTVGAQFHRHESYRLIFTRGREAGASRGPTGLTSFPAQRSCRAVRKSASRCLAVATATAQGFTPFFRGPERKFADESIHAWFQSDIFGGDDVLSSYGAAFVEAGVVVIFML